jgi:transcriptional regulator GlxA family with amidase domain
MISAMTPTEPSGPRSAKTSAPRPATHPIVVVAFDDVQLLDVAGPVEVFTGANLAARRPFYDVRVAALSETIRTSSGLALGATPLRRVRGPLGTLLVAGGPGASAGELDGELLRHVRRLAGRAERVASVCSGALVLAACGVLDGRRATTHWAVADLLAARHPAVRVDADPIYIEDAGVWTSAGVTAGIDLSLALVASDLGAGVANTVARWLVLAARRTGLQSQFSPHLVRSWPDHDRDLDELVAWMRAHVRHDLSVPALARRVHLSERQLARRFKQATGHTPADFVEALRLDAARDLLETTSLDVASVARRSGFPRRETFHRAFAKRFGATPAHHRVSFGARPA